MHNLKELKKQYEELGEEIERLEKKDVADNDPIFLLSEEEYFKYKDRIPHINCWWWWLCSPGNSDSNAAFVSSGGVDNKDGFYVGFNSIAVRPALWLSNLRSELPFGIGIKSCENYIVFNGVTWIKIDNDLYIAEVPIAFRRFDLESNDYEKSEIRKFLLEWFKERQKLN